MRQRGSFGEDRGDAGARRPLLTSIRNPFWLKCSGSVHLSRLCKLASYLVELAGLLHLCLLQVYAMAALLSLPLPDHGLKVVLKNTFFDLAPEEPVKTKRSRSCIPAFADTTHLDLHKTKWCGGDGQDTASSAGTGLSEMGTWQDDVSTLSDEVSPSRCGTDNIARARGQAQRQQDRILDFADHRR